LKVLAKEGISFMCFINCTLRESNILQGICFILVEPRAFESAVQEIHRSRAR